MDSQIQTFAPQGRFILEHYRQGELLATYDVLNSITNQGKNKILDCMFNGSAQIAAGSWFLGLIDNGAGSVALAAGDTLASHAGWSEWTGYSGSRPLWGQGASSGQAVTNAVAASFTITAVGTLYGIFIASVTTGGLITDILWTTAAFATVVPVASSDVMRATYSLAT